MTKKAEEPKQIEVENITDLELAEYIVNAQTQMYQVQQSVTALLAEMERRKNLLKDK